MGGLALLPRLVSRESLLAIIMARLDLNLVRRALWGIHRGRISVVWSTTSQPNRDIAGTCKLNHPFEKLIKLDSKPFTCILTSLFPSPNPSCSRFRHAYDRRSPGISWDASLRPSTRSGPLICAGLKPTTSCSESSERSIKATGLDEGTSMSFSVS